MPLGPLPAGAVQVSNLYLRCSICNFRPVKVKSLKNTITPFGMGAATCRFVEQCLNQMRTAYPKVRNGCSYTSVPKCVVRKCPQSIRFTPRVSSSRGEKLPTYLHSVPWLRIIGSAPPPPICLHNVMVKEVVKTTLLLPLNKM
jgi:hypothetical protein